MKFEIIAVDKATGARAGILHTGHGTIETPVFMPVGTAGTVKALHTGQIEHDIKARIILGNTYHLYLRPGLDVIHAAGGIHGFSGWKRAVLTDSGGYQVYSLAGSRKITDEGVIFRSHIDGSRHVFSPEKVMDIQRTIGADIIMAFDECTPYPCDYEYARYSMGLTHTWLKRCFDRFSETESLYDYAQSLFPIVQGSVYRDLRKTSAEVIASYGAEGNAIGGLSVGEPHEVMYEMTELVCGILPKEKPRYLMGVGTPENILESISFGVDMFDCVMPTRNGRNGMLFTSEGTINIKNEKWKMDFSEIDPGHYTFVDSQYTKAYLRHLFVAGEMLAAMISSIHNLGFYAWMMKKARQAIIDGNFSDWKRSFTPDLSKRL